MDSAPASIPLAVPPSRRHHGGVRRLAEGTAVGVTVSLLVTTAWVCGLFESTERVSYDQRCRWSADPSKADPRIVCVYIDEPSIARLKADGETWPWHREYYAGLVDFCRRGGAQAVVFDSLFLDPSPYGADDDRLFGESMKAAGNVVVALPFVSQATREKPRLPPGASLETHGTVAGRELGAFVSLIAEVSENAARLGDVTFTPDRDGVLRSIPIVATYSGAKVPALGLAAVCAGEQKRMWLDEAFCDADFRDGQVLVAGQYLPLDDSGRCLLKFHGGPGTYRTISIVDLFASEQAVREGSRPVLPPESLRGKYVIVGMSAAGLYDLRNTPLAAKSPGAEIHAALIDNLLNGRAIRRTPASFTAGWIVGLALAVGWAGSLLSVGRGFAVNAVIGLSYAAGAVWIFGAKDLWVEAVAPEAAVLLGMIGSATVNYALEGREKRRIHGIFGKFVSPTVVQDLVKNPDRVRLGGERKEVTVFFSDLAGFTTMSEQMAPERLVVVLNEYLSAMSDLVIQEGGTLDKYIGDAIMAFWGAPLERPDHAVRACLAALANAGELEELRRRFRERGYPEIHVRIGLNTGPAVIGLVGSDHTMNYTAIGDTVNLASRLEGANKTFGTTIMISESTREAAKEAIESRELELIRVKGKQQPVRVYELLCRRGELHGVRKQAVGFFEIGLGLYRDRRFKEAAESFERALVHDPADGPSRVYLDRCREYLAEPPAADWDGVYVMKTK